MRKSSQGSAVGRRVSPFRLRAFGLGILLALLLPLTAWANPRITNVELESTEPEVRVIVEIDPPTQEPAFRLMRDDRSLRVRFADIDTDGSDELVEDETLRRVRVVTYRNRTILRIDPRSASAIDLMERTEVQPHPRGVVVVIQRSDLESSRYHANHSPAGEERASDNERAETTTEADNDENEDSQEASATTGATTQENDTTSNEAETDSPPTTAGSTESDESSTSTKLRAAGTVGFIFLLGGVAWYMRRKRGSFSGSTPSINVVATKRIGTKQSLLLIEVSGKSLLVGTTEKGMVRLGSFDEHEEDSLDEDDPLITDDEEIAPLIKTKGKKLTPLEQELRRSALETELGTKPSALKSVRVERESSTAISNMLAAQAMKTQSQNQNKIQPCREITAPSPDLATNAAEGLLRLRQMVDDIPVPKPVNGTNGTNSSKGKDNGLAALESLLQAN